MKTSRISISISPALYALLAKALRQPDDFNSTGKIPKRRLGSYIRPFLVVLATSPESVDKFLEDQAKVKAEANGAIMDRIIKAQESSDDS